MPDLMTIGEFAAVTWLSPKALRLYDRKGLLSPDTVDPYSGYRLYSPDQITTARLITMLRRVDMPLELIRELLNDPAPERARRIARFREEEDRRHTRRQSLTRFLEHAVREGSSDALRGNDQPGVLDHDVRSRVVPETPVLSSVRHTSAKELPDVIGEEAERLFRQARQQGGCSGDFYVVYHGQVGWESDGPIEICVPTLSRDRADKVVPEHREVFTAVPFEDIQFPRILTAFEAVQKHAETRGLRVEGPPREVYRPIASTNPHTIGCDVALPTHTPPTNRP